ncbi:MAG: 7-cyano-7-deazaguanine synthase QueC [Bacteroidales bacterium]|nr:7-cyano-7-deazaguanine synthase QueC [Bacteroidales bacterium]
MTGDVRSAPFYGETAAIVLLSGGQDSTVCLFWALRKFKHVEAVCFSYGQKHSAEIEAARAIARQAGVPFRLLEAGLIAELSVNSLTNPAIAMDKEQAGAAFPNTFVPGRNLLFLTLAAIVAREKHIFHLVTGVSQADYSGYPDCRDTFIRSLNVTLNLAMDEQFVIHTPLMQHNKKEVWQLADELGVFDLVRNDTITCYNGIRGDGCGECPSCKLRKKGLTEYLNNVERH